MKIGVKGEIEFSSSFSDIKFSSLPASDVILIHEDDNLAVDVDQNFPTGIKLT